jgi:hypothetical protein
MKINSKMSLAYFSIFCYRRFFYIAVLILLSDFPGIQVILKLLMTLLSMVYVLKTKPHDEKFTNKLEVANEVCILLFDYHLIMLMSRPLTSDIDPETMFNLGWSFIGVFVFFLFVNMSILVYNSLKAAFTKWYKKRVLKKAKKLAPAIELQIKFRMGVSSRLRQFAMKNYVAKLQQRAQLEPKLSKADKEVLGKGLKLNVFQDKEQFKAIQKTVKKGRLEIILEEQGDTTRRDHDDDRIESENEEMKDELNSTHDKPSLQAARDEFFRR